MHDGIELETRGIPSVAIHTSAFLGSARAHASAFGRPDYEPVIMRHPIAGLTPDEVIARADEIMPTIVAYLLGQEIDAPSAQPAAMSDAEAAITAALSELRSGFNADGADLEVVTAGASSVTVRLIVTPETCLDCIVPKSALQHIVESAVRKAHPTVQSVELIDPREVTIQ
ncbi:hypothetical protein EPN52_13125 [bacterium]|nr:MAG: hypothetical protein EPN52_13125 [bacterium]